MINPDLPIKEAKRLLLYSLDTHDIVILTAQTGSGKTTQIPKYLIEAGYTLGNKKIGICVPRRIAAVSIARRVSEELGVYNHEIAHHVRFNSTINEDTRVVFMTDGMMVQQLYQDPLLSQYSVIMLDDIHEKSINTEILFGFLKKIITQRLNTSNPLKILITSATLETAKIEAFFKIKANYKIDKALTVKTINVPGRLHEVKINYLRQPTSNYFLKIFQSIIYIQRETIQGHILVFLTSVEEIEGMANMLDSYSFQSKKRLNIMHLHAGVTLEKQAEVFEFSRDRKIILATNIAESSITIPDIKYVIDCGYVKVKAFDPNKGVEKMIVVPCGRSAAIQRAGRAGRVFDGECFRIYTQNAYEKMPQKVIPQLLRVDLSSFILKLLGLGVKDILEFEMLDIPPQDHFARAIDTLSAYELVNEQLELSPKGQKAAELSLDIRLASLLLNSFDPKFGCSQQILMLVSMLEVNRQVFKSSGLALLKAKKKIGAKQGDFITLINIFLRYSRAKGLQDRKKVCGQLKLSYQTMEHALKIHQQLIDQIKRFRRLKTQEQVMMAKYSLQEKQETEGQDFVIKSSSDEHQAILRCILSGYFTNIAQLQGDGTYSNIRSKQRLQLHPTSILSTVYPEWVVYHEVIKSSAYFIHNASQIQFDWIFELAGHFYKDMRKEQAEGRFAAEKDKKREDFEPKIVENKEEKVALVQVGQKKAKPELFKTSVLGLKNMKKNKLSFQQDFDI